MRREETQVLVLMTGGTIDAVEEYDPYTPCQAVAQSRVPATLRESLPELAAKCSFYQSVMKDSALFSEDEIRHLAGFMRQAPQPVILMTHGTDKMATHAKWLAAAMRGSGKIVIITGSMLPLSHGEKSDGKRNLEFALKSALSNQVPEGVWVAMPDKNGKPQLLHADDALTKMRDADPAYFRGNEFILHQGE